MDSNHWPFDYRSSALPTELYRFIVKKWGQGIILFQTPEVCIIVGFEPTRPFGLWLQVRCVNHSAILWGNKYQSFLKLVNLNFIRSVLPLDDSALIRGCIKCLFIMFIHGWRTFIGFALCQWSWDYPFSFYFIHPTMEAERGFEPLFDTSRVYYRYILFSFQVRLLRQNTDILTGVPVCTLT